MSTTAATCTVDSARPTDAAAIAALISREADGRCIPLSFDTILTRLDGWAVARDADGTLLACACLHRLGGGRAELRSVVVAHRARGSGVGSDVVRRIVRLARSENLDLVCATSCPGFFASLGFEPAPLDVISRAAGPCPEQRVAMRLSR